MAEDKRGFLGEVKRRVLLQDLVDEYKESFEILDDNPDYFENPDLSSVAWYERLSLWFPKVNATARVGARGCLRMVGVGSGIYFLVCAIMGKEVVHGEIEAVSACAAAAPLAAFLGDYLLHDVKKIFDPLKYFRGGEDGRKEQLKAILNKKTATSVDARDARQILSYDLIPATEKVGCTTSIDILMDENNMLSLEVMVASAKKPYDNVTDQTVDAIRRKVNSKKYGIPINVSKFDPEEYKKKFGL